MVAGYQTYYSSTGSSSSHHDEQTALLTGQPSISATQFDKDWNTIIRSWLPSWKAFRQSKPVQLIPSITLGAIIWFCVPASDDLTPTAIRLLAVFVSCIFALITTSVDISLLVLSGLTLLAMTHSFQCEDKLTGRSTECRLCGTENPLTGDIYKCNGAKESFHHSLEGFSSSVVWLIFAAFHLGKAVEVTHLGRRVSLLMIKLFGKHIMGLAYAIVISAPFVPSNTARGGGIVHPVVHSIATTLGSTPTNDPKVGGFLMLVGSHSNLLSASMYLTGMAANPIVVAKASQLYPEMTFDFLTWFKGSVVPGMVCAVALPLILYWACGMMSNKKNGHDEEQLAGSTTASSHAVAASGNSKAAQQADSIDIVQHAQLELEKMGSMSAKEWQLCLVLLMCLVLWVTSSYTKLDATLVALLGLVVLLHMGTMTWKDISKNTSAWDTLFWLGGFVTMAHQLSDAGASAFLGHRISNMIEDLGLPPVPFLAIAYFLTTFMFSSLSAHIVAFVATFLDAGHALGANPMLLTVLLAYFGTLSGCMTNYSTGMAAMYYASGYVSRSRWFIIGFQLALFYIVIYFTVGMGWWRLLGWWN
ncbi:anion transporter [Lichtheimia corymbifera JMRC:FSU:9682]|uniref:Anion transporter n=1 Tax=Lichtheimia corymbifera JMRC:FSU:9682 TaxID=1263082 RepID=A0A068RL63_9FUNG|nr:anion transporter [Lichtheimia corymbifera JMRC:FSU:9682]